MKATKLFMGLVASASLALPVSVFAGANEIVDAQKPNQPAAAQPGAAVTVTNPAGTAKDLLQAAKSAGGFNTWLTAIDKAGLSEMLKSGEYTVFAPTDEAFSKLPTGKLDALFKDPAQLQYLIKHHIVANKMKVGDVALGTMRALSGESLAVDASRRHKLSVDGAVVIVPDIMANNGVMHGIDRVIVTN